MIFRTLLLLVSLFGNLAFADASKSYFVLIETLPNDAEVFLNNQKVGQGTPLILQLPSGEYHLKAISGKFQAEERFQVGQGHVQRKLVLGNAGGSLAAAQVIAGSFDKDLAQQEIRKQFNALSEMQHPDVQAGEAKLAESLIDDNRLEIRWQDWVTIPWSRAWIEPPLEEGTLTEDAVLPVFVHWENEELVASIHTAQGKHQLKSLHPPVGKVMDGSVLNILVYSDYIAYDGAKQVILYTLPITDDEYLVLPGEHEKDLWRVAISPDGSQVASAGEAGVIILFPLVGGEFEPKTLLGHSDEIWGLDFSPNGQLLASASHDKTIKLWDVESGQLRKTLTGHNDYVIDVDFSPDGKTLASASRDETIKLWDVSSGEQIKTLYGHDNTVVALDFSPDGTYLASGSYDNTVKLWDVANGRALATRTKHQDAVWGIAFSPDGKLLASGSYDGTVNLWKVENGTFNHSNTFKHSEEVMSVAFSPDGLVLYSGGDDGVYVWEVP